MGNRSIRQHHYYYDHKLGGKRRHFKRTTYPKGADFTRIFVIAGIVLMGLIIFGAIYRM